MQHEETGDPADSDLAHPAFAAGDLAEADRLIDALIDLLIEELRQQGNK